MAKKMQRVIFTGLLSFFAVLMFALVPGFASNATAPLTDEAFLKNGFTRDYLESSRDITFDNVQKNRASGSVGPLEKKIYIEPSSYTDASMISVSLYIGDGFSFNDYSYLAVQFADLQITSAPGLNITDCVFWFRSGTGEKHYVTKIGQWGAVYSEKGFFGSLLEIGVDISFSSLFDSPQFSIQFDKFLNGYKSTTDNPNLGYSWFKSKNSAIPVTIKWSDVIISPQRYNNVFENKLIQQFNFLKDHISSTSGKSDALLQQQTDTIKGQTDSIMNGFDSTAGNAAGNQLDASLGSLESAEDNLFGNAGTMIDFDDYKSWLNLPGILSSAAFVSSILTLIYQYSGNFGVILIVGFILFIITRILGMQHFVGK